MQYKYVYRQKQLFFEACFLKVIMTCCQLIYCYKYDLLLNGLLFKKGFPKKTKTGNRLDCWK